tara:strand:- start:150 stop:350 length:201 start_codon:yes stop_codon:yes gene_type:complete
MTIKELKNDIKKSGGLEFSISDHRGQIDFFEITFLDKTNNFSLWQNGHIIQTSKGITKKIKDILEH